MDSFKVDLNEEYNHVISLAAEKHGYSDELRKVMEKVLPAMLEGQSYEDRQLFYKMLSHTPIVVIPEDTDITMDDLNQKYLGTLNPHIKEGDNDMGEYGNKPGDGAFVSEAILDENLNILGRKQYLYVKSLDTSKKLFESYKQRAELFGTGINVSHLMHELGHAWVSEIDPYSKEGEVLIQRCGTANLRSEFIENGDGTYTRNLVDSKGLMLEEAMNTEMEVDSVARYLGITREEADKLYKGGCLIPSNYQGMMSSMANRLLQTALGPDFKKYRLTGDKDILDKINDQMSKTEAYQMRMATTEESRGKDQVFLDPATPRVADFLARCREDFYPDKENMTPVEILDNSLLQCFDMSVNKMSFDIMSEKGLSQYRALTLSALTDGYVPINQANQLMKSKESKEQDEQK